MKKKSLVALTVVVCIVIIGVFVMANSSIAPHTGYFLKADNGSRLVILDNSPIVMINRTQNGELFDSLQTGDKIFVLHDGINESYPGSTGVYACFKLKSGDESNIPDDVEKQLRDLGWLDRSE